ncbi:MAG: threonine-phosphate decarboxylase [Candidatus Omnitrophica bacterium]|nr:threonine-phosphate decarboxylase [Candidatus Omnitrophota bacterium]
MKVRHGGELRQFSEKFGVPIQSVLDFSSNINPWGPPESVKKAYQSCVEELQYYPDSEAMEFRREVAHLLPIWPENVIAGNGAMELVDLALRFLRPKRALLIEPTFLEYRHLLNLLGAEIRSVRLREGNSFQFPLNEILNALQSVDVMVLAHPNNPTGTFLEKENLLTLLREAKRRDIFVILDEAFVDWMPDLSIAREIRDDSYFFIVRSLTKFFSLPGIRIGYGLGSRKLVEKLITHQVSWSCNRLAQKLGIVAFRDTAFAEESRSWLAAERDWLVAHLGQIPLLKVFPSVANFLLVKHAHQLEKEPLLEAIGKQGIYLRDLTEFPGLGPSYFRVAVRKREDNLKLIEALSNHFRESEKVKT